MTEGLSGPGWPGRSDMVLRYVNAKACNGLDVRYILFMNYDDNLTNHPLFLYDLPCVNIGIGALCSWSTFVKITKTSLKSHS